jgi:hypothetical protein
MKHIRVNIFGLKLIVLTAVVFADLPAQGQIEPQINFSNLLFYEANGLLEYGINNNTSVTGMVGYVYGFPDAAEPNKYFYVGAEYRLYVAPKHGIDRFFLSFYTRYKTGYYPGGLSEEGILKGSNFYESIYSNGNVNHQKLTIGITLGSKWKSPSGFIYGFFIGGGRNVISQYSSNQIVSNEVLFIPETYQARWSGSQWDNEDWDFRFGITIGWRIEKRQ